MEAGIISYRKKMCNADSASVRTTGIPVKFSINQFLSSEQGSPLSTYHVCSIGAKGVSLFNVHTLEFPQFRTAQDLILVVNYFESVQPTISSCITN